MDFDLAQGDAVTVVYGRYYASTTFTNSSSITNRWVTLCYASCKIHFVSDKQMTGKGFFIAVKFQDRKPSKCFTI